MSNDEWTKKRDVAAEVIYGTNVYVPPYDQRLFKIGADWARAEMLKDLVYRAD